MVNFEENLEEYYKIIEIEPCMMLSEKESSVEEDNKRSEQDQVSEGNNELMQLEEIDDSLKQNLRIMC